MKYELTEKITSILRGNGKFERLGIGNVDGRIDLRGLVLPKAVFLRRESTPVADIDISSANLFEGVIWKDLDFTASELNALCIIKATISNCIFDECQMPGFRIWGSTFVNCAFRRANLKEASLGPVGEYKRNRFSGVDFEGSNLAKTTYNSAIFENCTFKDAQIDNVNFQGSSFKNCLFEGQLRDVLFYDKGFGSQKFPPNEMVDVDFTKAELHYVAFRGLTLDKVRFPENDRHIIVKNYAAILDQLLATLDRGGDILKKFAHLLRRERKYMAPDQWQAVFNVEDLEESFGVDGVKEIRDVLRAVQNEQRRH